MGRVLEKGRFLEHDGKSVEYRNGSRSQLNTSNEVLEHFNRGATIPPGFVLTAEGTAVSAATYGTGAGGWAVITSDDVLAKSHSLNGAGLNWQADRQSEGSPLVYEIRVKAGTLAGREFWFGLSDDLADTDPIALSLTSTFTTSVPTDGVFIGYSDTPTSGAAFTTGGNQHAAISINGDTNVVAGVGGGAFATDTFYTYRIEVSSEGNAVWFVNGKVIASKGEAISVDVPLTHVAYAVPRATAGSSEVVMTIDYIYVGGM